ncbi:MAG TPA: substrate-binding domain-containing protein [Pirellulaceae bacterium]|nr:substrate-binding domain-containing protein [Pirellulaceae bacterium]
MFRRHSRLVSAACIASLGLLLAGCPSPSGETGGGNGASTSASGTKRIVFLTNGSDPFWDACRSGLEEGAKQFEMEAAGYTVAMEVNNGKPQGQIDKLRQFASQGDVAAVAISVIQADNAAIIEEMKNLQSKGIKIITVDGDVNREKFRDARSYYIGTDNIVGGRTLGTTAKAILEARSKASGGYVQFAGFTDNDNARSRMNGFKEAIGDSYTELDRMADGMDKSKARENVRNAIANHQDELAALVGIWAYNAPAIAQVVEETNTRDKYTVVTFDAQAVAIEEMAAGKIDAMVVQNPFDMGVQTVRLLKAMLADDQATIAEMFPNADQQGGDIYTTGLRVVVPAEGSPVHKDLFDEKVVEYMLLPDFKAWLAKYKLTSS